MILPTFSLKRFALVVVLSILTACQIFSNGSTEASIENPESQTLKLILVPKDIPGKWSWLLSNTNQPSRAEWLHPENLSDSASNYMKGDYWFAGKQYYISILHNVAQYVGTTPEAELSRLHSVFDKSEEIEPPNLQSFGSKTIARCFDSESYLDCTIVVSYHSIESNVTIVVPKGLGVQELENLLNSILKVSDDKVINIAKN
jgi:hypothetical protein